MIDASDPVPALKRELARAVLGRLAGYPQLNIARRLAIDWPRVSNLRHGQLRRFSLQQLARFAARVDGDVTIAVTWRTPRLPPLRPSGSRR